MKSTKVLELYNLKKNRVNQLRRITNYDSKVSGYFYKIEQF